MTILREITDALVAAGRTDLAEAVTAASGPNLREAVEDARTLVMYSRHIELVARGIKAVMKHDKLDNYDEAKKAARAPRRLNPRQGFGAPVAL